MSWPSVKLGDIFDIARGGSPRPIDDYITDEADGVNWISIKDASNGAKYITNTSKKIKPSGLAKSREVFPGDFLLTNSMSFGRPYILKTSGCIHDGWLVLRGDPKIIDQDYFYHLLGSDSMYRNFSKLAAGAVVKNLNIDLVKTVEVPLPPLPEQRRIAAILDKAEALRSKRREAIAKLDQLLQSVFLEMFGDPTQNIKNVGKKKISDICIEVIDCPHSTPIWSDSGKICIRTSNLGYGEWIWNDTRYISDESFIERTKRSNPKEGDIVLSREGTIGVAAIVEPDMLISLGQRLVQLRANEKFILPTFLLNTLLILLSPEKISNYIVGATSKHLNVKDLRNLEIAVPSIEKQIIFDNLYKSVKKQKKFLIKHNKNTDIFIDSLKNQFFAQ